MRIVIQWCKFVYDDCLVLDIRLDTITSDSSLLRILTDKGLSISTNVILDYTVVNNTLIAENIDLAVRSWQIYPWYRDVPEEIFLNYLLPYKVYGEKPCGWREYFSKRYAETIRTYMEFENPMLDDLYYEVLVNDVGKWYQYDPEVIRLTRYPGFDELMAIRRGECYKWSYLNVYILRSLGIPAALDFIPQWGSKNSGHASEVFWDNHLNKFRTAKGRKFSFPAKVFRYSYKRQHIWTDSIKPVTGRNFLLEHLMHNHWTDVTADHTKVADIEYVLPGSVRTPFAYICVFNYGMWRPVYWGKVFDGKVRFENMGTEMLYRIAVPQEKSYELISSIFHLDEKGNKRFFKPKEDEKLNLYLSKLNTGGRSWVEAGKSYSLYYYDEKNDWNLLNTQNCEKDSLIVFEKVPSNTLYKLINHEANRRLERIFTYENEKQFFW